MIGVLQRKKRKREKSRKTKATKLSDGIGSRKKKKNKACLCGLSEKQSFQFCANQSVHIVSTYVRVGQDIWRLHSCYVVVQRKLVLRGNRHRQRETDGVSSLCACIVLPWLDAVVAGGEE